jgi:hypothetical protein
MIKSGRLLADCPAVLFIVYTPGQDAEQKGYEPWLVSVDNPFFNAIPGVHHYANWKIEHVLTGGALPYDYFDFQGLTSDLDLEQVWFNSDLDRFRTEWVRLWGYGLDRPSPIQMNAYLMAPVTIALTEPTRFARITGGVGAAPGQADIEWQVSETIRKHFSIGRSEGPWRVPTATDNPLGLDWVSVTYGEDPDSLIKDYERGDETVAFVARLLAAPDTT